MRGQAFPDHIRPTLAAGRGDRVDGREQGLGHAERDELGPLSWRYSRLSHALNIARPRLEKVDTGSALARLRTRVRSARLRIVLQSHEVEQLRRSHAMAPLSRSSVDELLESCAAMAREREALAALVRELPVSFSELRSALNELHRRLCVPR